MKKLLPLLLSLVLLASLPAFAQGTVKSTNPLDAASRGLTKFSIDFPGGTPGELAAAIQKALGRPLNVIVPVEHANWALPPLKMSGVNVMQLFTALEASGPRRQLTSGYPNDTIFGFRTNQALTIDDDSIWTFYLNTNGASPKVARFYLLTPYLEAGLTVDDITTAIQTSWRMLDDKTPPALSFHKETKMLIAVGDPRGLETIDSALRTLDAIRPKPAPAKPAEASPKPAEEKKTKS